MGPLAKLYVTIAQTPAQIAGTVWRRCERCAVEDNGRGAATARSPWKRRGPRALRRTSTGRSPWRASLARLRALAAACPAPRVVYGHEPSQWEGRGDAVVLAGEDAAPEPRGAPSE